MSKQDFVWLDKREAKCTPLAQPCSKKARCARFLVEQNGRPSGDYTVTGNYYPLYCGGFLNAADYRTKPAAGAEPHEAVKGLA